MNGGEIIADVLKIQGTQFLFTLCGGHISPILVACGQRGIRVVDTRHEATAVFAADAVARQTGEPGVAAVTAGPGVTNSITALKNAQMAQSPLVLIAGAAPTALRGRGALQDIDQMKLVRPLVKWSQRITRRANLAPSLEEAFRKAQEGVPGPVFLDCPVDLLYPEEVIRQMYDLKSGGRSLGERALKTYLRRHVNRMFSGSADVQAGLRVQVPAPQPDAGKIREAARRLKAAERPLLLIGSQATQDVKALPEMVKSIESLSVPVYLSGMARGLLGRDNPLQFRHKRREALKEADLVILAGVPCDFRLDYGNHIRRSAFLISANRSPVDLKKNRRPQIGILGDPGSFLRKLASQAGSGNGAWEGWKSRLREREDQRRLEIDRAAIKPTAHLNPLHLLGEIENCLPPSAIIVADGGDFVGSASYIVQPRGPLTWLDPGAFGTLGAGAGFALGVKLCHPEAEVWILYGDGAAGYSLVEFDTFVRHSIPVIAVVGNDASWSQIAREQVEMLGDDVGTVLEHSSYHRVVEGFGAVGLQVDDPELISETLQQARDAVAGGKPVLVNAILGKTDFRKGSISM